MASAAKTSATIAKDFIRRGLLSSGDDFSSVANVASGGPAVSPAIARALSRFASVATGTTSDVRAIEAARREQRRHDRPERGAGEDEKHCAARPAGEAQQCE